MPAAPLQLERLFFTEVRVKANAAPTPKGEVETFVNVNLFRVGDDQKGWGARVLVETKPKEGETHPYEIHLDAFGQFAVAEGIDEPHAAQLIQVTGASIIYSAAREYLMMLTGRGPWGAFQLPTVSFSLTVAPANEAPAPRRSGSRTPGSRRVSRKKR